MMESKNTLIEDKVFLLKSLSKFKIEYIPLISDGPLLMNARIVEYDSYGHPNHIYYLKVGEEDKSLDELIRKNEEQNKLLESISFKCWQECNDEARATWTKLMNEMRNESRSTDKT